MLLGTLGASLLGNLLTGKGILRAGSGNKKGKGIARAGTGNNKGNGILRAGFGNNKKRMGFLMPPHPLTNFEIEKSNNEPRFNGVFSKNNLPEYNFIEKIKDGAYIINLDEYANVGTHWTALFCKKMKLFNSIVLLLNIFLKKLKILLKNSLEIKI